MGLFDGARKEQLAEEITERMKHSALVGTVLFFYDDEKWVHSIIDFDDSGRRKVILTPNLLYIYCIGKSFSVEFNEENGDFSEIVQTNIGEDLHRRFSSLGFRPLTAWLNEKGREEFTIGKMLFLLTTAIRARMQDLYPNIQFSEINETCYVQGKEHVAFTYAIPKPPLTEWI